ncbi:MAG: hypothetical protein KC729_00940 [Candidatus Eisenbacteria bacterium]|uniref:Uncharacterized protein n=1 Tax=Eiseniibacteriota bacterium TaxID=2212470 RepID=A0A956LVP9_UNCEI|nr:hypothetical protein [Candidatus Eisenbacteria bacterium]
MGKTLDTVLLFALPASGKSEVRTYLDGLSAETCESEMHLGATLQLDDYPYVHFMHRIDDELQARGQSYVFFKGPTRPFIDNFEWGTLVHLLNEDYANLLAGRTFEVPSAAQLLFDRLDEAHAKVGLPRALGDVPYRVRQDVADALETECRRHLDELNRTNRQDRRGRTIVIEAARGGPNGAAFPLTPPHGYQYAMSVLSEAILDRASILYVWVTPEESRRKNIERGRPDGQGSILFHSVPMEVMLGEYGCDDMEYLIRQSDRPDTIKVEKIVERDGRFETRTWWIPVGRFDNRQDLTSFVRDDRSAWKPQDVEALHQGLAGALGTLARLGS